MFKVPRKVAFLTIPAVLALGAVSYGGVVGDGGTQPERACSGKAHGSDVPGSGDNRARRVPNCARDGRAQ
jgi:hypothetical protein